MISVHNYDVTCGKFKDKQKMETTQGINSKVVLIAALACLLAFTHCARAPLEVDIFLSRRLNGDRPLPVDLVVICDDRMLNEVMNIRAKDWFRNKFYFAQRYKPGRDFHVLSREWAPGQRVNTIRQEVQCRSDIILVFANYEGNSDYRAVIRDVRSFRLEFHEEDFGVYPID